MLIAEMTKSNNSIEEFCESMQKRPKTIVV